MTTQDLYAIYTSAYSDASHFEGGKPRRPAAGLARRLRRLLSVERAIDELGRHDATDGRPMRTRVEFANALMQGRSALTGLEMVSDVGV